MGDIFSPDKRREVMSRIRGKNTKPELLVHGYLRRQKIYFQRHYRSREGIVIDIALPRRKHAIFIDGDFWHGRSVDRVVERRGKDDFWSRKLLRNRERDQQQTELLLSKGWKILRVWESDLIRKSTRQDYLASIETFLSKK